MTLPLSIDTFNAYKTAVWRALAPQLSPATRGLSVRLNPMRRHVDVILHQTGECPEPDDPSLVPLRDAAAAVSEGFADLSGFTTAVCAEPCDATGPIIYRGCPVWGRAGTQWQLAPDLAALIEAQSSRGSVEPPR